MLNNFQIEFKTEIKMNNTIKELKDQLPKKEFDEGLFDVIFKKAENTKEVGTCKYIQIPKTLNYIKNCDFENCKSLTSIAIPNSVISIGYLTFYNCNSLTSIAIPKQFEQKINDIFKYADLSKVKVTYT